MKLRKRLEPEFFDKLAEEYRAQGDEDSARSVLHDKRLHEAYRELEAAWDALDDHMGRNLADFKLDEPTGEKVQDLLLMLIGFFTACREHEDGPCPCAMDHTESISTRLLAGQTPSS